MKCVVGAERRLLDPIYKITEALEMKSGWVGGGLQGTKSECRLSINILTC